MGARAPAASTMKIVRWIRPAPEKLPDCSASPLPCGSSEAMFTQSSPCRLWPAPLQIHSSVRGRSELPPSTSARCDCRIGKNPELSAGNRAARPKWRRFEHPFAGETNDALGAATTRGASPFLLWSGVSRVDRRRWNVYRIHVIFSS